MNGIVRPYAVEYGTMAVSAAYVININRMKGYVYGS